MFKKCLENRITHRETGYKCYLCHFEISENNFDLVLLHLETDNHKQKYNQIDEIIRKNESEKLCTISETERRKLVENYITCNKINHCFVCHLCKCTISGLSNTFEHIKGILHKKAVTNIQSQYKVDINSEFNDINQKRNPKPNSSNSLTKQNDCLTCKKNSNHCKNLENLNSFQCIEKNQANKKKQNIKITIKSFDQIIKVDSSTQTEFADYFVNIFYCNLCKRFLYDTELQCHAMTHLHKELDYTLNEDIIKFRFNKKKKTIIKCLLCNIFVSRDELEMHFKTALHVQRLQFFLYLKDDLELHSTDNIQVYDEILKRNKYDSNNITKAVLCKLCNSKFLKNEINQHFEDEKHKNIIPSNIANINFEEKIEFNIYACFLCEKSFCNISILLHHYKEDKHKLKIQCFKTIDKSPFLNFINLNKSEIIKCTLCKINIINCKSTIEHLLGKKHKRLENNENINTENINEKSKNIDMSTMKSTDDSDFNTNLEELVDLSLSDKSLRILKLSKSIIQKKSQKPNTKMKTTFDNNVLKFGESFIKHCIDYGKENIYNIDPEKIHDMKLSIALTFPSKSNKKQKSDRNTCCLPCEIELKNEQLFFEHLQNQEHVKNLHKMVDDHKEFEKYPHQFSDLKLAKYYMQEESDEWIYCYACNIKVKNENNDIYVHTKTSKHMTKSQIWKNLSDELYLKFLIVCRDAWYYAQLFLCEICNTKCNIEIDFIKHLESEKHLEKITKLKLEGNIAKFDMCPICITYWCGKSDSYNIHCKSAFHKHFATNGDFMVPNMTVAAINLLNDVDKKIDFLINESNKVILEENKHSELLTAIEETVKFVYPNVKAYIFGSRLSDLGFPDSDVDVFVDCENVYYKSTTQKQCQQYLLAVKEYFETKVNVWIIDEILLVSRVPIMKLKHLPTGLKCDISFVNALSVEKSKVIKYYNAAYPVCRKLILFLKKWLILCKISGSDCITTFAISWFVIFYFQIKNILPTVCSLKKQKEKSKIVDGWECSFSENISINHSDLNFHQHLKNFFSYYADFDYKNKVICPYLGKTIKRRAFAYSDELPEELNAYIKRVKETSEIFRFDSPMCIQDPIDLTQNITKAVKKLQLRCFRQYCIDSAKLL